MSLKVSEGGAHSQPPERRGVSGASCMPLCQTVGGWVGWGRAATPPFALGSVSFSQDGEGSVPVMLVHSSALGDKCGLGGEGVGA